MEPAIAPGFFDPEQLLQYRELKSETARVKELTKAARDQGVARRSQGDAAHVGAKPEAGGGL